MDLVFRERAEQDRDCERWTVCLFLSLSPCFTLSRPLSLYAYHSLSPPPPPLCLSVSQYSSSSCGSGLGVDGVACRVWV
jgi:hypothetical protein